MAVLVAVVTISQSRNNVSLHTSDCAYPLKKTPLKSFKYM